MTGEVFSILEFYKSEEYMKNNLFGKSTMNAIILASKAARKNGTRHVEGSSLQENANEEESPSPATSLPMQVNISRSSECQQSIFKLNDCYFDTLTASKCFQNDILGALSSEIHCDACGKCINQSDENNSQQIHFSKEAIECPDAKCKVVSHCRIFMNLHKNLYKHIDKNKDITSSKYFEQIPTKEDLMVCTNCELYFDTFQKQSKF